MHDGFVKVIEDETYGEILGVHIIGPQGYELIAEAVAAMEAEATVATMMHTIHAHPTIYEAVGEAFNAVERPADQRVINVTAAAKCAISEGWIGMRRFSLQQRFGDGSAKPIASRINCSSLSIRT